MKRTFHYEARNSQGELISGQLEAENALIAIAELERSALTVEAIRVVPVAEPPSAIQPRDEFQDRLQTALERSRSALPLLESHLSEIQGVHLAEATRLRNFIAFIREHSDASAVLRTPQAAEWIVTVLKAWAPSYEPGTDARSNVGIPLGTLPAAPLGPGRAGTSGPQAVDEHVAEGALLEHLLVDSPWLMENVRRGRLPLYPLTGLLACLIAAMLIGRFVVPPFAEMFRDFGLHLPLPTQMLMAWSELVLGRPAMLLLGLSILIVAVRFAFRLSTRSALAWHTLGWIASGSTSRVLAMSRFTAALGEMLRAGAALPVALRVAGQASGHYACELAASKLAEEIHGVDPVWESLAYAHSLPGNVVYALSAGQGGGPSVKLLRELATLYGERGRHREGQRLGLHSFVGLAAYVALGIGIAFIAIAILLPLVSMVSALA
jgi:type II secretory pathway component PulF